MIVWVIAGLLGLATGLRIGWALVNKQSLVSTAMILALGSLGVVAALNWRPLTLLIDTALHRANIAVGLSQLALIGCAAGSCVMITSVASVRTPATVKKIAFVQYAVAAVIAAASVLVIFSAAQQPEMAPEEYLRHNLGAGGLSLPWLIPLLYVLLALSLVVWAGLRHSNRTRRGRALFVFTVGIVLLRAAGTTELVGVGAAATLLGCAMLIVPAGSLLPSLEDWFGARRELRTIQPLLDELGRRPPDGGIGVRPRGPLVFRVAERMSLISDALFLEATAAGGAQRLPDHPGRRGRLDLVGDDYTPSDESLSAGDRADGDLSDGDLSEDVDLEAPDVTPVEQAQAVAGWIRHHAQFPGLAWLRQPVSYSDREWILEIARQYRDLGEDAGHDEDQAA